MHLAATVITTSYVNFMQKSQQQFTSMHFVFILIFHGHRGHCCIIKKWIIFMNMYKILYIDAVLNLLDYSSPLTKINVRTWEGVGRELDYDLYIFLMSNVLWRECQHLKKLWKWSGKQLKGNVYFIMNDMDNVKGVIWSICCLSNYHRDTRISAMTKGSLHFFLLLVTIVSLYVLTVH